MGPDIDILSSELSNVVWYGIAAVALISITYALTTWMTSLQVRLRGRTRLLTRLVSWVPLVQILLWLAVFGIGAWLLAGAPLAVVAIFVIPLAVAAVIGSRDLARDAIAGAILAFEHTIVAGDIVHVSTPSGEISGRITAIGVRRTLLRTSEDAEIFLPNQTLLNSTVRTNPEHKLDSAIEIAVPSGAPFDAASIERLRQLAGDCAACSRFASIRRQPDVFVETDEEGAERVILIAHAFAPEFVRHLETDILEMMRGALSPPALEDD